MAPPETSTNLLITSHCEIIENFEMNGPLKMYQTKQIVQHDFKVQLPNCMYKLKNIHGRNGTVEQRTDHVSSAPKKVDIFDQVKQFLKV